MNGVVKPLRRSGWSARGVIASVEHGQRFETQVGPREFASKDAALEWLHQAAADRSVELGGIFVAPAPGPGSR